jgi:hypothetical protein
MPLLGVLIKEMSSFQGYPYRGVPLYTCTCIAFSRRLSFQQLWMLMHMVTLYVADGLRAILMNVEGFAGTFRQILMEKMYDTVIN